MKFNRIFAALLALLLSLGCLPRQAQAETIATGTCGESVIWELSDQGVLTISGTGPMDNFSDYSNPVPWKEHRDDITAVVVKPGVTYIGSYTFAYHKKLKTVDLPTGMSEIGAAAFSHCDSLETIVIPEGVTKVGNDLFHSCINLKMVVLPQGLRWISSFMFYNCKELAVVVIPKSVYQINRDAFSWCTNLWHVLYTGSKSQWKRITIQGSVENSNYCLESATRHYKCDGTEVTDVENKICSVCSGDCDHVWNDGVIKKEPTCTEDGQMRYTCGKCEETKSEAISALGHEYTAELTAPTCTEQGYTVYTCSQCQETMTQDFTDPTGHSWDEGVVTTEPTESAVGQLLFTCGSCGETRTEEIPMKEPAPTEPTEPAPTEPAPTEPAPTEPEPIAPSPKPTDPPADNNQDEGVNFGYLMIPLAALICIGGAVMLAVQKKRK